MTTPNLKLVELSSTAANQATVVNGDWAILDQMVGRTVKSRGVNAPPVSPSDGDAYIVGTSPTGLWSGKANQVAFWRDSSGVWSFIVPLTGWTLRVQDDLDANGIPKEYGYTGSAWGSPAGAGSFTGGTLTSALNEAPAVTLASAATVNIGAAAANTIIITGTTTITAFDTIAASATRRVIFGGILTLTHNATSLILPTGASITTAAGDVAEFISLGSGEWRCVHYLRANGQPLAGGGGGGLTNFTETKNVASPNATVPVVALSVTITETNGDVAYIPKGSGSFLAAIPDGMATGGDKRGTYAVDLQLSRTSATKVAAGNYSALLGGLDNQSSGTYGAIVGGTGNGVSNSSTFVGGGSSNNASGLNSGIIAGDSITTSGQFGFGGGGVSNNIGGNYSSWMGGSSNVTSANYATGSGGQSNTVSSQYGSIHGGLYAITRGVYGMEARASGRFSTQGDAQRERLISRNTTTNASSTPLLSDGSSVGATTQVVLPTNSAFAFRALIVARANATGDAAAWEIRGLIKKGSSVGSVALVGTPAVTSLGADSGASSWTIAAVANTSYDTLTFNVTGVASTTIRWVADIETIEVVG